MTQIFAIA